MKRKIPVIYKTETEFQPKTKAGKFSDFDPNPFIDKMNELKDKYDLLDALYTDISMCSFPFITFEGWEEVSVVNATQELINWLIKKRCKIIF